MNKSLSFASDKSKTESTTKTITQENTQIMDKTQLRLSDIKQQNENEYNEHAHTICTTQNKDKHVICKVLGVTHTERLTNKYDNTTKYTNYGQNATLREKRQTSQN